MSRLAACILALLPLAGCVTVEATLRPDGSGVLEMTYRASPDTTEFWERRQYASAHVHVDTMKIYESQRAVLRATVDDVTQLGTAPGFRLVDVRRERDGDDERLAIRLRNPRPEAAPEEHAPWLRIGLTVPGRIRSASHDGVVAGDHVAWTVTRAEYTREPVTELAVRWRSGTPR